MRTRNVGGITRFFRDVLELEAAGGDATLTFQRLPTHRCDLVEVYAQEYRDLRMIPDDADFVIAFVVDDIREAMAEVLAAGFELVNEPVWAAGRSRILNLATWRVLGARAGRSHLRDRANSRLMEKRTRHHDLAEKMLLASSAETPREKRPKSVPVVAPSASAGLLPAGLS